VLKQNKGCVGGGKKNGGRFPKKNGRERKRGPREKGPTTLTATTHTPIRKKKRNHTSFGERAINKG